MTDARLIATLSVPPTGSSPPFPGRSPGLEVRADLAGDLDAGLAARPFRRRTPYSCARAPKEGLRRLAGGAPAAAADGGRALRPGGGGGRRRRRRRGDARRIPPARRLASWSGAAADAAGCARPGSAWRASRRASTGWRCGPSGAGRAGAAAFAARRGRRDVTAFATGPAGTWTRVLAPAWGTRRLRRLGARRLIREAS